jgi:urea carboxylase
MANRLVGNALGAAGAGMHLTGPTLKFNCDAVIALTGAPVPPLTLDGIEPCPCGSAPGARPAAC